MASNKTPDQEPWQSKAEVDAGQISLQYVPPPYYAKKMIYLNEEAPDFDLPAYQGDRYERTVPDTFDIQHRAALIQHTLTQAVDPDQDYLMYFGIEFARNPAIMAHSLSDICQTKYLQMLPLLRVITGDETLMEVERTAVKVILKQIGPDGLHYWPVFPYNEEVRPLLDDPQADHFFYSLPYLPSFLVQYLRNPIDLWNQAAKNTVDGLKAAVIDCGEYAYMPEKMLTPDCPRQKDAPLPLGNQAILYTGWTTQGLGIYFRLTGYDPAGQLARKFSYYLKDYASAFDADGHFLSNYHEGKVQGKEAKKVWGEISYLSHFHLHTCVLLNMLEYAIPANDQCLLDFIVKSYEWARAQGESRIIGSRRREPVWPLGCFSEHLNSNSHETIETCEVADMIGIALKLSAGGIGDYWDDVDGWIRNQFAESQIVCTDWLHEFSESFPKSPPIEPGATDIDVIDRNMGGFAGWAMPNAWMNDVPEARTQLMHCCTANAARAIYYIFEHILNYHNGRIRINLLLNRASPWVDIDSHLPCQGRVDVIVKQPIDLELRIPIWVDQKQMSCRVSDQDVSADITGSYLKVSSLKPGDSVTVTFPMTERMELLEYQKRRYEVTFRGADAVAIDPPGTRGPFYQRQHYRTGKTPTKKVQRFASTENIEW